MILRVKRIKPVGLQDYPALRNVETKRVYVDTCLGIPKELEHDNQGYNSHGEYVAYNIPGRWCTFNKEPECPLKKDIEFELVNQ
jgi:hypothetical protein